MNYEAIAQKLGFDTLARLNGSGLMYDEIIGLQIPFFEEMGFPPAMVPLANSIGSMSYFGAYIYDIDNLKFTFVDLMIDEKELYEVGLNEKQFCYYLARRAMLDYYEEDDEDIASQISKLCLILGVDDPSSLGDMSDDEFLKLDVFKNGIPIYLKHGKLGTSVGNTGFQRLSDGKSVGSNLKIIFDDALDAGEHQKAWDVLNCPGWSLSDAKSRFKKLVDAKNSELLSELYEEWIRVNHPIQGY